MFGRGILIKTLLKHNFIFTVTCVRLVQSSSEVRVRFAPSPTGFLHLGGLRTALYNFLFARSKGGAFILRIEDTDQTRIVEGAMEQMLEDLKWAGIVPDEGPIVGGESGPYLQSKRLDLYKSAVEELIDSGAAYYCFCTEHRLELLRKDAVRRQQTPRYDNKCRHLTTQEIQAKLNSGGKPCVRLKLIPGCGTFHDLVYGNITHEVSASEGDPVIFKKDGFPTYHLANVVDDHHMRVSHVLRGVEWQPSTPKHLMLYKGFGWEPPQFAHLPLLLNANGSKLSKRQEDVTVQHYRTSDIFPRALINFVTFSGGGFHRDQNDKVRSLDVDELASEFDVSLIGTASCQVSLDRLDDFNHEELVRQMANDTEMAALLSKFRALVVDTYKDRLESLELDEEHIRSLLLWSQKRITRLSQLAGPQFSYLWVRPPIIPLDDRQSDIASATYERLQAAEDFSQKPLVNVLRTFANENKIKFAELMHLMRMLLCGCKEGPAVAEMLEILGKENSLARIKTAFIAHQQSSSLDSKNCTQTL